MASRKWSAILDYLRSLSAVPAERASDADLLDRFIRERDEAAFALLFERHGPLVWGVCRRVLGWTPDAEDAFQATFFVLLRRAHAIGKRTSLRSWLYGVAYRVAARARANRVRRPPVVQVLPGTDVVDDAALREVRAVLDDEVSRLPERLRLAIVLCYFEGRTHDEAAQLLGCPRGTIASHVARARQRLHARLVRRGVTLTAGACAATLAHEAALAAANVPIIAPWVAGSSSGAVPAQVANLAQGATRAMLMTKLKMISLCSTVLLLIAGILTAAALATPGAQAPPAGAKPQLGINETAEGTPVQGAPVLGTAVLGTPVQGTPVQDPLDAARKASIEAGKIQSAAGTAIFEQYIQDRGAKELSLRTRAKVKVSFDQGKYLLRFAYETKLETTTYESADRKISETRLAEVVILYDGKDAYSITFADKISPAGCMMEIYPRLPVPEFPWKDPARLATQVFNLDDVLKNLDRDAVKMTKLTTGGYRGSYHFKNAPEVQCTFDVEPEVGLNVTTTKVSNRGNPTVVQSGTAKWKKIAGRWYVEQLIQEFDNRHLSERGYLQRSVLRYETFEPGAKVDAKQFTLEALPIPEKVYRIDRRSP
jgi:RNA polymerase sigma factor (sigma-70 family)